MPGRDRQDTVLGMAALSLSLGPCSRTTAPPAHCVLLPAIRDWCMPLVLHMLLSMSPELTLWNPLRATASGMPLASKSPASRPKAQVCNPDGDQRAGVAPAGDGSAVLSRSSNQAVSQRPHFCMIFLHIQSCFQVVAAHATVVLPSAAGLPSHACLCGQLPTALQVLWIQSWKETLPDGAWEWWCGREYRWESGGGMAPYG